MKHLLIASIFFASIAQAAEIKVFETPKVAWAKLISGNFQVNKSMGRAWVEVRVSEDHGGQYDHTFRYYDAKVEGLYFDANTSKIMLEHEGALTECAQLIKGRIFTRIKETNCELEPRTEKRLYDDGFRTYMREYIQLYLVTK